MGVRAGRKAVRQGSTGGVVELAFAAGGEGQAGADFRFRQVGEVGEDLSLGHAGGRAPQSLP